MHDRQWWDLIQKIFKEACQLPAGQRPDFLKEACSDDQMRREVDSLLRHQCGADAIFGSPPDARGNDQDQTTDDLGDRDPGAGIEEPSGPLIAERYEVVGKLGEGGMGAVFRVRDHVVGKRLIALKRILRLDDHARDRFRREIDAVANLNHRNICKVFDRGEDDEGPFFTMELLAGGSLRDRVEANGPLSDEDFVDLTGQLAQALRYAHRKSVQHRDIKPGNVLFAEDGDPKLADFGLARVGLVSSLSFTNLGLGTFGFSAPEQLRDSKTADHRADIYSLGATLYYALTGKVPVAVIEPSEIRHPWQAMILKCMKEDPSARYFHAEEILEYLEKTPTTSVTTIGDKCGVCGVANPSGASFCHKCGAGLTEPCPCCRAQNRVGEEICPNCQVNIPRRKASDNWLHEARAQLEKRAYRRAAKAASEAVKLEPDRDEVKVVLAEAQDMLRQLESFRGTAVKQESAKHHEEAQQSWKQVLEIDPENKEAIEAIARIDGEILDDGFLEQAKRLRAAIDDRNLARATRRLQELRTISAPVADRMLPQAEDSIETLRRALILDQRDKFEDAFSRCDQKESREAIRKFSELKGDPSEARVLFERLRRAERWWRRRRSARRLVAGAAALLILTAGYLVVAGWYNGKRAHNVAVALSGGLDPNLNSTWLVPSLRWNLKADLNARSELCQTLDEYFGGSRRWRQDLAVDLFNPSSPGIDLIIGYNWFVLSEIADGTIDDVHDLLPKITLEGLESQGIPFKERHEHVRGILEAGYIGQPSLESFADPLASDPMSTFVSNAERKISDPKTTYSTIENLTTLLAELQRGNPDDAVVAHNQNVLREVSKAFNDERLSEIDGLLDRIYSIDQPDNVDRARILREIAAWPGEPPPVDWLVSIHTPLETACDALARNLRSRARADSMERNSILELLRDIGWAAPHTERIGEAVTGIVGDWNEEIFAKIDEGFRTDGGTDDEADPARPHVTTLLSELDGLSNWWSYLGDARKTALDRLKENLRLINEHWHGEALTSIGPLCQFDRVEEADLWDEFLSETRRLADGAYHEDKDIERADHLLALLFALTPATNELDDLAKQVVFAWIEAGDFNNAATLAAQSIALAEFKRIAEDLDGIEALTSAQLRNLEGRWPESDLPRHSTLDREVATRLSRCLPRGTSLESLGEIALNPDSYVDQLEIVGSGSGVTLSPRDTGGKLYRVPYLEDQHVTLLLKSRHGVEVAKDYYVVYRKPDAHRDVAFLHPGVVEGESAILEIRPRNLPVTRVRVEGQDYGDLDDGGDHWRLVLTSPPVPPDEPLEIQDWAVQLEVPDGIQDDVLSITIYTERLQRAKVHLGGREYGEVFEEITMFLPSDHQEVRDLARAARNGWIKQLSEADRRTWDEVNLLMTECQRFLRLVPARSQQGTGIGELLESTWIQRIELTTTWESVDALKGDLAFLRNLKADADKPYYGRSAVLPPLLDQTITWLEGAMQWAQPIVDHMRRPDGDWSTDRVNSIYPALLIHRGTGLEFVYVPGASFQLGGESKATQVKPRPRVTVSGFYLSKTEVTNAAWLAEAEGDDPSSANPLLPKTRVAFDEATAWCHERGLDLPTEAEWELAAGGRDSLVYPWGKGKCRPNVDRFLHDAEVAKVGSVECDESDWCGAMDMAGNVREWCYPVSHASYRAMVVFQDPPRNDGVISRGSSHEEGMDQARTHHRGNRFELGPAEDVGLPDTATGFRPVLRVLRQSQEAGHE